MTPISAIYVRTRGGRMVHHLGCRHLIQAKEVIIWNWGNKLQMAFNQPNVTPDEIPRLVVRSLHTTLNDFLAEIFFCRTCCKPEHDAWLETLNS